VGGSYRVGNRPGSCNVLYFKLMLHLTDRAKRGSLGGSYDWLLRLDENVSDVTLAT